MADIFLALVSTEAGVDRHLVLKRVLAERARDPLFSQMFLDEARLAAQLQHPNIAQVYDVGKIEGAYFFTMEYVHGEDVRAILYKLAKSKRKIPINLALHIAAGALAALHYAHERTAADGTPLGVVHRDVSPSNVMVSMDGQIKLLDFGVAKAAQRSQETRSGSIKGKVSYLSPEQCRSTKIDRRTDIYALGIVLWELLTGHRLYRRETDFATMLAITNEDVPSPVQHRADISPEVERLVMTALQKDLDKRYASAAAMLEDLEAVAAAERMILSPTAMGRFMKELFGSKVEPWKELAARADAEGGPLTITGESLTHQPEPTRTGEDIAPGIDLVRADKLRTELLAKAPDLRSDLHRLSEEMAAVTPMSRNAPVWGEKTPEPSMVMTVEESVATEPAPRSKRTLVIALAAAAFVGIAAIAAVSLTGDDERPAPPPVETPAATAPPEPAPPAPEPPAPAPEPSVATGSADVEAPTAPPEEPPPVEPPPTTATTKTTKTTKSTKTTKTTTKPKATDTKPKPKKDPCKDPAYVEANPLKCE